MQRRAHIQESEFVVRVDPIMSVCIGVDISTEHLDYVVGAQGREIGAPNTQSAYAGW